LKKGLNSFLNSGVVAYVGASSLLQHCSCLQIARAFGASEIIAVDVLDEKLQNAKTLGATHTVNAAKEDAVERIKVYNKFVIYPYNV
jgi:Zn-dependent alcohol dehydrogenase